MAESAETVVAPPIVEMQVRLLYYRCRAKYLSKLFHIHQHKIAGEDVPEIQVPNRLPNLILSQGTVRFPLHILDQPNQLVYHRAHIFETVADEIDYKESNEGVIEITESLVSLLYSL